MTASEFRSPVVLRGRYVELAPLAQADVPGLARAGRAPEVWRYLHIGPATDEASMATLVRSLLRLRDLGEVLPFSVRTLSDRRTVGLFRYLDIHRDDRAVEVGTWLDPAVWRTPVNTEVKYLGLRHAFETESFHRVQLKTDVRNERSQRAIERLGAVREGVLREHLRLSDGAYRSSVYYSVLAGEWPAVRARLEGLLDRAWDPGSRPSA